MRFPHPNDLVEMSHTCSKYKALIAEHFERKRQCGWVDIISGDGRSTFDLNDKEEYETYFRSKFRNIVINFKYIEPTIDIFQFI